jgi:ABC-type transport system involved in multi-copper enzyme maturation permease subunit
MSPTSEIWLIFTRELRKSIRSVKGIILAVLAFLISAVVALLCIYAESAIREKLKITDNQQLYDIKEQAMLKAGYSAEMAHSLATVPIALQWFLKFSILIGPVLVAILGFDSVSSDVQHRAVRYWTVRTRRWTYMIGKFLGLWATVSFVTLSLNVFAALAVMIKGYITPGAFFTWGLKFWITSALICSAWCSVAIFISAQIKTPLIALLAIAPSFFFLWILGIIGWFMRASDSVDQDLPLSDMSLKWFEYIDPNGYDDLLLNPRVSQNFVGLAACLLFWLVFVGGGAMLFERRDV